jgi:hypothetical protein
MKRGFSVCTSRFLSPFSAVLWFVLLHWIITGRRSSYFHQFLVFVATAVLIFILIRLGVYRLG